MATRGLLAATVTEFDPDVGRGTVLCEDGRELPFHATAIADGSRAVAVGTKVVLSVVATHLGVTEAGVVLPLPIADST